MNGKAEEDEIKKKKKRELDGEYLIASLASTELHFEQYSFECLVVRNLTNKLHSNILHAFQLHSLKQWNFVRMISLSLRRPLSLSLPLSLSPCADTLRFSRDMLSVVISFHK